MDKKLEEFVFRAGFNTDKFKYSHYEELFYIAKKANSELRLEIINPNQEQVRNSKINEFLNSNETYFKIDPRYIEISEFPEYQGDAFLYFDGGYGEDYVDDLVKVLPKEILMGKYFRVPNTPAKAWLPIKITKEFYDQPKKLSEKFKSIDSKEIRLYKSNESFIGRAVENTDKKSIVDFNKLSDQRSTQAYELIKKHPHLKKEFKLKWGMIEDATLKFLSKSILEFSSEERDLVLKNYEKAKGNFTPSAYVKFDVKVRKHFALYEEFHKWNEELKETYSVIGENANTFFRVQEKGSIFSFPMEPTSSLPNSTGLDDALKGDEYHILEHLGYYKDMSKKYFGQDLSISIYGPFANHLLDKMKKSDKLFFKEFEKKKWHNRLMNAVEQVSKSFREKDEKIYFGNDFKSNADYFGFSREPGAYKQMGESIDLLMDRVF